MEGAKPFAGYTATKKLGGAVVRNRAKRRMRAAVFLLKNHFLNGHDYVIIARSGLVSMPFELLKEEMTKALDFLNRKIKRSYGDATG